MTERLGFRPAALEVLPSVFAIAVTVLITVTSFATFARYEVAHANVIRNQDVAERTAEILSSFQDAETGQRGYLLTGRERYLEPYRNSTSRSGAELRALGDVLRRTSDESLYHDLSEAAESKFRELDETIQAYNRGHPPAALAIVNSDRGQAAMDRIRQLCRRIVASATRSEAASEQALLDSIAVLRWVGGLGLIGLVALLLTAQVTVGRARARRILLIEQLHKSREELMASQEWLRTTLLSIGDAVIATDAEGRVTLINPVAQNLTGWNEQSAIGVSLHRVFRISNETTGETVENPVEKVIRTGRIVGLANHTVLTSRDGRQIAIDDSAAPIRVRDSNAIWGTVLVFRDNTERRRAEAELRLGRKALEESNTMLQQVNADLELFAYAAGHDLQEPLRTVASFSELLARRLSDQPDTVEYIRFIQAAVARMHDLIECLLDYARLLRGEHIEREFLSMEEVAGQALLNCNAAVQETNANVKVHSLPKLYGNRLQLTQLLQNLISNAIKYRSERPPDIEIEAQRTEQEQGWRFRVRDNGIGFDMAHADKIFQAFHRLNRSGSVGGSGLGLAMCRRIVELHGGRMWAESQPGVGSSFSFLIADSSAAL